MRSVHLRRCLQRRYVDSSADVHVHAAGAAEKACLQYITAHVLNMADSSGLLYMAGNCCSVWVAQVKRSLKTFLHSFVAAGPRISASQEIMFIAVARSREEDECVGLGFKVERIEKTF